MRRALMAAVLLLAAGALAGCTASGDSASDGALPEGVTVEVRQMRDDVQFRQAQLVVRNDGDADWEIRDVVLDDPRFDGPITRHTERTSRSAPGSVVMIRLDLPAVDCDADDEASTRLDVGFAVDGADDRATATVADPLGVLAEIHERDCLAERLAETVVLSVEAFRPSAPPDPGRLVLRAEGAGGDAPARILAIQSTPLLSFPDDLRAAEYTGGWPVGIDVPAGSEAVEEVSIPVVPNRCDPHVIQEDKRGTIFTIDIELHGAPGAIELAAPPELKGRMLQWVADWCGMAG